MAAQDQTREDIFKDAEKVEVLGKLPALLWAYVRTIQRLLEDVNRVPDDCSDSTRHLDRLLGALSAAADHLGNEELKQRLNIHSGMLADWSKGGLSNPDFVGSMSKDLTLLERLAGPPPMTEADAIMNDLLVEKEVDRVETIKAGRSPDIIVNVELLDDIRKYLTNDVLTEDISSILVIDSAGSLVVNVGNKLDMDVVTLAAVAAANFAATEKIAHLIGEEDFVLLFYKGHNESFHFRRVGAEYIVVTIFDNSLSLGLLRLKLSEVAQVLESKLPKREG